MGLYFNSNLKWTAHDTKTLGKRYRRQLLTRWEDYNLLSQTGGLCWAVQPSGYLILVVVKMSDFLKGYLTGVLVMTVIRVVSILISKLKTKE